MERICTRWIPKLLTDNRERRVNASRAFLKRFKDEGEHFKSELRVNNFYEFSEMKQATIRIVRSLDSNWCKNVYEKLVARHENASV